MINFRFVHAHRWLHFLQIGVVLFAVSACGPLVATPGAFNLISGQAEILSIMGTEKTISDHIISLSSGKNCSTVRRERGLHYCEEDQPDIKPQVYCYNTLGRVTCYDRPDPFLNKSNALGNNDHNFVDLNAGR